ncbi:hypothetical protein U1E44_02855 [Arenibacter sp. GZD96]|uniref:hypothetical protein n=1 Tax=Aurantibrevibacter litoralis TaxID=3106030 RepID=UPI002B001537|nr:hypothetical protein [Arenibacter sp. GZD-96]MEA1785020.1 hypothetical protein [Arenibacter sp. GZD-96]
MENNTIYIVVAVLVVIYFGVQAMSKKRWKERKSRGFMDSRQVRERKKEEDKKPE